MMEKVSKTIVFGTALLLNCDMNFRSSFSEMYNLAKNCRFHSFDLG